MPRWILACPLLLPLACDPKGPGGFGHGQYDDTSPDDSDTNPVGDCAATLGTISANQTEIPGRGWAAESHVPFTEGSCAIDDAMLIMEWLDENGVSHTEDPWTVGFKDEDTYVETYDALTGEGSIYVVVVLPEEGYHFEFEVWLKFPDGSLSNHASAVVN